MSIRMVSTIFVFDSSMVLFVDVGTSLSEN